MDERRKKTFWQKPYILREERDNALEGKPLREATLLTPSYKRIEDPGNVVGSGFRYSYPVVAELWQRVLRKRKFRAR